MFQEKIKQYVLDNAKSVVMRECGNFPGLFVLKYKKHVFYNNSWDEFLEHCRGTVVDKDFNIVSYPFQKIYNYGIEKSAPVLDDDTQLISYRKINGFMVAMTYYNGDVLVSTTGSTDSPYVVMAKEMMIEHLPWEDWRSAFSDAGLKNMTVMFECVHPDDSHVIAEQAGMYVIGYRKNEWCSPVGHSHTVLLDLGRMFNCLVPECKVTTLKELKSMASTCRHEGFVAYTNNGTSFKIKSPYYLTSKWVARNPRTEKLIDLNKDIKLSIDEEYHDLIDTIRLHIVEYTAMSEQERLAWVRKQLI